MIILGVNAYHGDSSAAIIVDGKLVAAIEEERIRRIKHWAGFPSEAIKWCLSYAGVDMKDVDYVAVSRNPMAMMHKKLLRVILNLKNPSFLKHRLKNNLKVNNIKFELLRTLDLDPSSLKAKIVYVGHHHAHIASGFFVSPFNDAALVSVDSFGDFASSMTGIGKGNRIHIIKRVEFPHSLGLFYTAMTHFLGFWKYGDEYKVMGLSANGKDKYRDQFNRIIKAKYDGSFELDTRYFLHVTKGVDMSWENIRPVIKRLFSPDMEKLLGPARKEGEEISGRFKDIAASTQQIYEESLFRILDDLHKRTGMDNLVLTGGCAQNSLANGKIYEKTNFKNVYIPPAAHDAGGAIGAAFYLWHHKLNKPRGFVMDTPFWGPSFGAEEIRAELEGRGIKYTELDDAELINRAAVDIADGRIVGWFQGRSEWGPRALGARSILADPRRKDMRDVLNLRIKKREDFRPFAPSILTEKTGEWFEDDRPVPFMEKVYKVRKDKMGSIPAVTNIDGTGRLQTVKRESNRRYYDLIKRFGDITGVPLVLNTSFNDNEPIVNTPADALDCFMKTRIDRLILENFYIEQT